MLAAQLGGAIEGVSIVPALVARSHVKLSAHPDLGTAWSRLQMAYLTVADEEA